MRLRRLSLSSLITIVRVASGVAAPLRGRVARLDPEPSACGYVCVRAAPSDPPEASERNATHVYASSISRCKCSFQGGVCWRKGPLTRTARLWVHSQRLPSTLQHYFNPFSAWVEESEITPGSGPAGRGKVVPADPPIVTTALG